MLWLVFLALMLVIFFTGKRLVKYGDMIAEKLNIGRTTVGVIFVASITSLPELITGISSVTYADTPDIAAGDIFGSCMFNLLILAFLDAFFRDKPITTKVHHGLTLSTAFGIIMITVAGMGIFLGDFIPSVGWISYTSILIIVIYLIAVKIVTDYERRLIARSVKKAAQELLYEGITTREIFIRYLINASILVFAAVFLPKVGKIISHQYGLTETFFGTLFVALTTSLPEFAVSIAAIKMNMITISVANILGSNIFNIFILAIDDIFYMKGSLFADMSDLNMTGAFSAVLMSSVVIIGLIYRAEKKPIRLAFESIALIVIYIVTMSILYLE
ncbi:MAG TPA: sodium:proton exchanger [Persephonella sp.]|uniref:Sodium/calcium exchanger membrane region n=1 Tax=Persephonella marina (strain DSM 14350 / EX-H1) TaxID=123214 RepID=C0QQ55_PERMH|nr:MULTISPECIES: sodium/calcium exchanger membrane region [Persephonella]ACO03131.1 sodium/calcium exchanger membrane region [Persephonella marina EX-H1]HCB69584.1 sodium:proton exchanger [Persephonella sp.]